MRRRIAPCVCCWTGRRRPVAECSLETAVSTRVAGRRTGTPRVAVEKRGVREVRVVGELQQTDDD